MRSTLPLMVSGALFAASMLTESNGTPATKISPRLPTSREFTPILPMPPYDTITLESDPTRVGLRRNKDGSTTPVEFVRRMFVPDTCQATTCDAPVKSVWLAKDESVYEKQPDGTFSERGETPVPPPTTPQVQPAPIATAEPIEVACVGNVCQFPIARAAARTMAINCKPMICYAITPQIPTPDVGCYGAYGATVNTVGCYGAAAVPAVGCYGAAAVGQQFGAPSRMGLLARLRARRMDRRMDRVERRAGIAAAAVGCYGL